MRIASRRRSLAAPSLVLTTVLSLAGCLTVPGVTGDDGGLPGGGGDGAVAAAVDLAVGPTDGPAPSTDGPVAGSDAGVCFHVTTLLDVGKAPGAGANYAKPTVAGMCTASTFVVTSNNIPHYTFVQTTPNPLVVNNNRWEITLTPKVAAQPTAIPLLGYVGFAVNGQPFFGPNEGAVPQAEAYGDPIYNGIMDPCLGHTANQYHYHSFLEKCLVPTGLVDRPWMNADPDAAKPSPVLGWAADGFPIYGPRECKDVQCTSVVTLSSGYDKTGDPKSNAWSAYTWRAHAGDDTFLDKCNGHTSPNGEYHYHATAGFPYLLGCFTGTPMGTQGGGMMGGMDGGMMMPPPDGGMMMPPPDGGMMMGPKACTMNGDCVGACPAGSVGCTCGQTPMGKLCVPTCNVNADCPIGMGGMRLTCRMGVCAP